MNIAKKFYGGVHPQENKISSSMAIVEAPLLPKYVVPLAMHIGAPAKSLVQPGQTVLKGQRIGEPGGFVSAAIHAPTSGTVKEITTCLSVMGTQIPAVVIESDGNDTPCNDLAPIVDWKNADPAILKQRVADAGIVGMGGAAFPTHVKLSPPSEKAVDTLIINGIECEPCLTADHRLMLESPQQIIKGILIVARILGVKNIYLGIEMNKPDAIQLMQEATAGTPIQVCPLRVRYPQGAEKQLIFAITGRKVPTGGLPMDVRCVVQNVGSSRAVADAIDGIPLYQRITTVTGSPVVHPGNWRFRIGTTYADALKLAGGVQGDVAKIISGGPMMGFSVYSLDIPIMKNTSGILLMAPDEIHQFTSKSCIRCGRCNDTCPMMLMPGLLSVQIENEKFDLAENTHVLDCMECGCCSFVCPAGRPLIQHMRRAKAEVIAARKSRK